MRDQNRFDVYSYRHVESIQRATGDILSRTEKEADKLRAEDKNMIRCCRESSRGHASLDSPRRRARTSFRPGSNATNLMDSSGASWRTGNLMDMSGASWRTGTPCTYVCMYIYIYICIYVLLLLNQSCLLLCTPAGCSALAVPLVFELELAALTFADKDAGAYC